MLAVPTRISPEHPAAIEKLAGQLDVPGSALVRLALAGLNACRGEAVHSAVERLPVDVPRLRALRALVA